MEPDTYDTAVLRLRAAGCVAAEEEAAELIAAAGDEDELETFLQRREQGEPLAWITGTLPFCAVCLAIDTGVYIPRLQSEDLARRAANRLPTNGRAADLCAGAGAIAAHLALARPAATVVAVDIDERAVACARRNHDRVVRGDLGTALRSHAFDVVTAVAPYVPEPELAYLPADTQRYEPRRALDGGSDGLDIVRRVVHCAARLLKPGGWMFLEVGGDQDDVLAPVLEAARFAEVATWDDEDGDLRGLSAAWIV